jgi:hypothetical protein
MFTFGKFITNSLFVKIKNTRKYIGPFIFSVLLVSFAFSSCKKTGPTNAIIYVRDSADAPVANAMVTLWQDTSTNPQTGQPSNIRVQRLSDASGRAEFEFSLEAYLNIEAVKNADTARSFVRLKLHETVEKTVHF